jgi:hypothetical protein
VVNSGKPNSLIENMSSKMSGSETGYFPEKEVPYVPETEVAPSPDHSHDGPVDRELVNASGHRQELERNFSLISICAVAVTTGNTWIAQGGSVVVALSNGGLAGTIYELYGHYISKFRELKLTICQVSLSLSATG